MLTTARVLGEETGALIESERGSRQKKKPEIGVLSYVCAVKSG